MKVFLILYSNEEKEAVKLITDFWKSHNNHNSTYEEALEDLRSWTKEGHKFYLIKYNEEYIGFVHLGSRGCEIDWLEDIFVEEKYQGQGIGSYVIGLIEDIVKEYSECLYIEAAARNSKVIKLYQKLGYNCLNTITIRKDFDEQKYETIRKEKIMDLDFVVKGNKK